MTLDHDEESKKKRREKEREQQRKQIKKKRETNLCTGAVRQTEWARNRAARFRAATGESWRSKKGGLSRNN
jgi:hypothetical protein